MVINNNKRWAPFFIKADDIVMFYHLKLMYSNLILKLKASLKEHELLLFFAFVLHLIDYIIYLIQFIQQNQKP